jgi:hypothetical protein
MEKLYLKRMEVQGTSPAHHAKEAHRQSRASHTHHDGSPTDPHLRRQHGPDRETIINFSDDPGVIHRGEVLPF